MLQLITDRPLIAHTLTAYLHTHGIFLYRTPFETSDFYFRRRDTGAIIVDCVKATEDPQALIHTLRERYEEMPIAAIVAKNDLPNLPVDALLRDGNLDNLCIQSLEFARSCGWQEQPMRVFGLTVGDTPDDVYYMGYHLPLAPREHVILRCLFYRAPHVTDADELMTLCYPDGRLGIGNLSVQISNINQRAAKIDPRPLVVSVYGKGYRLRDGL